LKQILGLPIECVLPADPVASHRRLDTDETCLSPVGIKNIEQWYAADYLFLGLLAGRGLYIPGWCLANRPFPAVSMHNRAGVVVR